MTKKIENNDFIAKASNMAALYQAQTAWLNDYRDSQRQIFARSEFPHPRVEHFKYNRLDVFSEQDFCQMAKINADGEDIVLDSRLVDGLTDNGSSHADRVVFVNGEYSPKFSDIEHHRITHFSDASEQQKSKIVDMLSAQVIEHNPFIVLNAALTDNGVLIEVNNDSSDAIIEIITISKSESVGVTSSTQVLFDVADNAKATVIGRAISLDNGKQETALSTIRVIANVGEAAEFVHYNLQLEQTRGLHFGSIEYNLQSSAKLKAFYAATGGRLKKIDITVNHLGQHAHAGLDGLYVATDDQQVDYHTTINHTLPNGTTDENFRGIINGSAEGVFNGRIHIHQDAQKTLAELSNKNLLLSDDAIIHTKPELEIYADDVVCAHGATVSRIDGESLYYLLARGISQEEAELMLSFGFFNEILAELDNQYIADYIRPILFNRFDDRIRGASD